MSRVIAHSRRRSVGSQTAGHARRATHSTFGVSGPYVDGLEETRPFAVTSRIGSIARNHRYADLDAAARGAVQLRRDLALRAGRSR
jgi:hypothetical protein